MSRSFKIGMILVSVFVVMAIVSIFWTPFGYQEVIDGAALMKPSGTYFFGTDDLGRDTFSRILVGARFSLGIGLIVGGLAVVIGASLGLWAAFYGGRVDSTIVQVMNAIQAMPSLLLALFVVAILGPGVVNTILSVTLVSIPTMFRLVRSAAQIEMSKDYITSARALGASNSRIIKSHLFPNCLTPLFVQSAVCCSEAILNTAALGFLGLGIPAPFPEWGTMLSDSKNFIESAPHLMTIPGLCLLLLILGMQLVSDGLRDKMDPKLRTR